MSWFFAFFLVSVFSHVHEVVWLWRAIAKFRFRT